MNYYLFKIQIYLAVIYSTPLRFIYSWLGNILLLAGFSTVSFNLHIRSYGMTVGSFTDRYICPSSMGLLIHYLREEYTITSEVRIDSYRDLMKSDKDTFNMYYPLFQSRDPRFVIDLMYRKREIGGIAHEKLLQKDHPIYKRIENEMKATGRYGLVLDNLN